MSEFTYEIIQTYGVIGTSETGWTTEVNLISWNGQKPKVDIRTWSPDHQKMTKGITLHQDQLPKLRQILNGIN